VLDGAPSPLAEGMVAGLSRGWPRDYAVNLSPEAEAKLLTMFNKAPAGSKGQLVRLAGAWGSKALDKYASEIISTLAATAADADRTERERVAAVQQLISFQPQSSDAVVTALDLVTPRSPPEFATEVIGALLTSQAPNLGPQLVERAALLGPRQSAFCSAARRPPVRSLTRSNWGRCNWPTCRSTRSRRCRPIRT
jgi:hypothetical protein